MASQDFSVQPADVERLLKMVAEQITETGVLVALRAWEDKQKRADERLYGWKAICAEVTRIRGTPTAPNTLRLWVRKSRFPVDVTRTQTVTAVRWEIERWLVAAGWMVPAAARRTGRPPGRANRRPTK